jgi:hypothetical protein
MRKVRLYTLAVFLSAVGAYFTLKSLMETLEDLDVDFGDEEDDF